MQTPTDCVYFALAEEHRLAEDLVVRDWQAREKRCLHAQDIANDVVRRTGKRPTPNIPAHIRAGLLPLTREELFNHPSGVDVVTYTNDLMAIHGYHLDDWATDGTLYKLHQRRTTLATLAELQRNIIHVLTERNSENEILHRKIRGLTNSHRFGVALNIRWKQLDNLVNKYNKEIRKIPQEIAVRPLATNLLKVQGLDSVELWDIDRMESPADWARFDCVRQGIEAIFVLRRAEEESQSLPIHVRRMVHWLYWQVQTLNRVDVLQVIPVQAMSALLLHRLRMIYSLLNIREEELLPSPDQLVLHGLIAVKHLSCYIC